MCGREDKGLALFVAKLERRRPLSQRGRESLLALATATRTYDAHQCMIVPDDERTVCSIIEKGFAFRHKATIEGGRRIVAVAMPGDMIDLQSLLLPFADFDVVTETPVTAVTLRHTDVLRVIEQDPSIAISFWLDTLVDTDIRSVWTTFKSCKSKRDRVARLLLEFDARIAALNSPYGFCLPLTHEVLGEALDMTAAQVERALRSLEKEAFLSTDKDWYKVLRRVELAELCDFNPAYLQSRADRQLLTDQSHDPQSVGTEDATHF